MSQANFQPRIEPEAVPVPLQAVAEAAQPPSPSIQEVLARLEEKTARIEEKLARSDAATARVIDRLEASSHKVGEIAQQAEVLAVRSDTKFIARRVKGMPSLSVLVMTVAVSAVATSILTALVFRFVLGR